MNYMLTSADIKKLIAVMKQFFYTKEELDEKFSEIDRKFSQLQNSVDSIARMANDNAQEISVSGHKADRLEEWAGRAGKKIKIKFETWSWML